MHMACRAGSVEFVRILVSTGADVKATTKNDETPLMFASVNGYLEVVQFFLDTYDGNVDDKDDFGHTALQGACETGFLPVVSSFFTCR